MWKRVGKTAIKPRALIRLHFAGLHDRAWKSWHLAFAFALNTPDHGVGELVTADGST
jgi:hypothetical protein